tara:strand:+ start:140 stop:649 length:510 start_codon:yes stop_codon:yes gene_type:complete
MQLVKPDASILHRETMSIPLSESIKEEIQTLADDMLETMFNNNGIGLAAPQIGIGRQIFVMGDSDTNYVCINPKLIGYDKDAITNVEEGCLSYPNLRLTIERYDSIVVTFYDRDFEYQHQEFKGIWARCFLHELDHLNGVTFTSKVSKVKLQRAREKARKLTKRLNKRK